MIRRLFLQRRKEAAKQRSPALREFHRLSPQRQSGPASQQFTPHAGADRDILPVLPPLKNSHTNDSLAYSDACTTPLPHGLVGPTWRRQISISSTHLSLSDARWPCNLLHVKINSVNARARRVVGLAALENSCSLQEGHGSIYPE